MCGVVDDAGQLALADPIRRSAQRQGGQRAAERQLQRPLAEQPGQRQDRHARDEFADDLEFHRAEPRPTARRGHTGDAAGPSAPLEFEGDPAAQRIADDVGGFPAQFVELAFHVVGQHRRAEQPGSGIRTAVVARHGRGEYLVPAGVRQLLGHPVPYRLGHQKRMQQQHRLSRTKVDRRASGHVADIKGGTAGTASKGATAGPRREKIGAS